MLAKQVIWKILLMLVIVSMLLAACAPAATPTAAPQAAPTTAPVVAPTTAPVAAPTTAPAAAPTTAPAKKTFKVAFVGAMVHPYYNPIPQALKDAERDFNTGPIEWQMPQKFDQNVQNVMIDGLVAKGYNLIGFQVADPVAGNVEMAKVVNQGIPVVTFAGCPETPSPSTFCLATDTGQSAYIATTNLIKLMGGKGNIVHLSGFIAETNTKKRMDGVQKAVDENPGVKLIQTITDIDTAETAQNAVSSLLAAKRSEINGIVATAYNPSVAVSNELRSLDEKNIKAVLIDSDPIVLDAIKDGYVSGTMSQNPYGQAYLGVYSLILMSQGYTWKKDAPWFIDSGTFLINKDNLATVEKDMAKLTSDMVKTWKDKYFDPPGGAAQPAPTTAAAMKGPFKYAFVGAMVHPYYNPIPQALKDAERDFNTGPIEWQMPQKFDQNVQNVMIDGLVAKGYNLIGFQVADPVAGNVEMAKVVNQGIPVVTFAGCPETPSPSTFCLATDTGQSAYIATTNLIKLMGGKGNIVHLSGFIAETNTKKRMDGVQKAVDENPGVKLIQTITDIDTAETAQNAVSSLLAAKRSEINGIVATAYNPSVAVSNELRSLDEKNIKAVLIDSDPIVLDAIKDGYVSGTMSQNPYGQAYLGVYSLSLMSQGYTWKKDAPWFIDSGTFLINKDNLATVEKDMAKLTSDMVKTWKDKYFDPPK